MNFYPNYNTYSGQSQNFYPYTYSWYQAMPYQTVKGKKNLKSSNINLCFLLGTSIEYAYTAVDGMKPEKIVKKGVGVIWELIKFGADVAFEVIGMM